MDLMRRKDFLRRAAVAGVGVSFIDLAAGCGGDDETEAQEDGSAARLPSEITIGIFAGDLANVQRDTWIPAVEEKYGTSITADDSYSSSKALATLQGEKGRQSLSLVMMDEVIVNQAKREGLLEPIARDEMTNVSSIPDWALVQDGHGVAFALSYMSMLFNGDVVEEPPSWRSLLDPVYKGKVMIPAPDRTSFLFLLIMGGLALQNEQLTTTGLLDVERAVEDGFEFLEQIKPQVNGVVSEEVVAFSQLAAGDIGVVAPHFAKYALPYLDRGANMQVAFPEEGAFVVYNNMVVPKGAPAGSAAAGMVDLLIAAEYQQAQAERAYVGPVNTTVEVAQDRQQILPAAGDLPEGVATQEVLDWELISEKVPEWQQRYQEALAT